MTTPAPKIAIITPSYNQGRFIEETIQSVLAQDGVSVDYLVIDGGSKDETVPLLKKYQNRLQWVSEKDKGQADAVNKGLQLAKTELIGWLNSDDIYYPHALKRVCDFFDKNPDIDVVYGKAAQIDEKGVKLSEDYETESWNLERLKIRCFLSQPAVFFRRSVIEKYGLLNPDLHLCLDYEYWLRLAMHGAKFAHLPEVLAGARIYAETKSSRYFLEAHREAIQMLKKALGYIPADWIVNYSTAKVKTETHLSYPHPAFILYSWLNLWKASGLYSQGQTHLLNWLAAQKTMFRKFVSSM